MKNDGRKNVWLSVILCLLMVMGGFSIIGGVSGEGEDQLDIDDYAELEIGTRESGDDWDQGDYVAINMTENGALSWFGVIYGTEEDPNGILIFCAYVRFLGAAEVYEANGDFVGRFPIPIVTVFGQRLAVLFEYEDNGMFSTPFPGMYDPTEYADNGLFDFEKREEDPGLWAISDAHEPVIKAVNLSRAWSRSQVVESSDPENTAIKTWDFSIWAEDIEYGIRNNNDELVLGDPDNVLEKLNFTFHVTANVEQVDITGVPWYEVTVATGNHDNVIDSEYSHDKDYVGNSVTADFKFDHEITGWDFSSGDGIVLINHAFFANAIPDKVEEWLDEQFVNNINGHGNAEFEALNPSQEDAQMAVVSNGTEIDDDDGDGIVDPKKVEKDVIRFKDNWQEIGELTWISNAEVDDEDRNVTYQVHGGQSFEEDNVDDKDFSLRGFIIQGAYVYPAGNNIYHDPALVAIALLFDVVTWAINLLPAHIVGAQFLFALIATVILVAMTIVRRKREKVNSELPPNQMDGSDHSETSQGHTPPPDI
jgi:hypothetical protein